MEYALTTDWKCAIFVSRVELIFQKSSAARDDWWVQWCSSSEAAHYLYTFPKQCLAMSTVRPHRHSCRSRWARDRSPHTGCSPKSLEWSAQWRSLTWWKSWAEIEFKFWWGQFYVRLNDILINNIVCQLSQFSNC